MKPALAILILFTLVTGMAGSAPAAEPEPGAQWKELLSKVHLGMRRAEVEKVLSRRDAADVVGDPELDAKFKKEGHVSLYILDHDWCAAIVFGSAFTTRNNPHLLLRFPDQKVIVSPQIWRRDAALNKKLE